MATILRPTMRATYNGNPQGSATAHVTMPGANPFDAKVTRVRLANAPRDMMPGMGDVFDDIKAMTAQVQQQTAGGTAAVTPATTAQPSWWAKLGDTLLTVGSQFAITSIQSDAAQDLIKARAKALQTAGAQQLPAAGATALPITIAYPQYAPSAPSMMPWIIGAGAVAVVGFIALKGRSGGGTRRRRSTRRR